jgi:hypothetical protein
MIWPTTPIGVGVELCARRVGNRDRERVAVDLRREPRHVVEQVRRQRYVGGARHADRLAVVERFDHGELVCVFEDQIGDPPDQPPAFRRGQAVPV